MLSRKPPAEMSDLELIEQYRQSSSAQWAGVLFSRYTSLVYGVCLKYLKNREDAQDATMQLFEKLLSVLHTHEITHFKSWLYVTARNHCLMQLRSRKGKYTEEISDYLMETDADVHLEDGQKMEENLVKLEKCIETLVLEQQQCVRLFFIEEKCYKDVSSLTGFDMNKVKSYIQNGKRNLKLCMERNE